LSTDAGSVRVSIFNQSYSLRAADGDGAHVLRVARLVDERMRAIANGLAVHDVAKVAVLTALNFADELEGLRSFYESELRGVLERAREEEAASAAGEATPPAEAARDEEAAGAAASAGPAAFEPSREEPSWFEAIFDTDAPPPRAGEERLSSQVTSRLRRLRQPPPGTSITEGDAEG
jgi:cell division protein ZapA